MSSSGRALLGSLTAILLLAGCATESFRVAVVRPAAVNLGKYDRVAIDNFAGSGGPELAADVTEVLSNARNPITGKQDFKILDRRDFDRILEELKRQRGDLWDPETVGRLGQLQGADVLMTGRLSAHEVSERTSEVQWVDSNGDRHTTYFRQAEANVAALIKASSTETGEIIDSVTYRERAYGRTVGTDAEAPAIDPDSLLATARRKIAGAYLKRVVPHEVYVHVTLYKDEDFPQLTLGNRFAKLGAWEDALVSYREALDRMTGELAEYRYKALFNMGVALQYTDQFEEARKALREAYLLEESRLILKELEKLSRREGEHRQLLEQGKSAG